jgi:hypothetical protein
MNYFTKLIDRLGNKPQLTTDPPKAPAASTPASPEAPVEESAGQTRP